MKPSAENCIVNIDREVAEILEYFRENASDLKKLGKDWGLNDEDIKECIQQAFSVDPEDLPQGSKMTRLKYFARKWWPKLRILLRVVGVMVILVGVGTQALQNERIDQRVGQLMRPLLYPIFRTVRLAATPLHDIFNMYDNFMEDCVMYNPLFDKNTLLGGHVCGLCSAVTTVTQFFPGSPKQGPLHNVVFTEPLLFKGKRRNVSLETFQSILSNNPFIKLPMQGVTTDLEWAAQVKDLMEEDAAAKLTAQPDFYFFWVSKLASTSHLVRKVFPRPHFFGARSQPSLRKHIFITGPKSKTFELAQGPIGSFSWYEQGWGSKEVELTPADMCHKECSPVLVTLHAGDILTYNSDIYTATVKPVGENISISFLGYITPRDF